jgi:hypothetical protein
MGGPVSRLNREKIVRVATAILSQKPDSRQAAS